MFQEFDIKLGQESVGKATVQIQGLYYKIRCRCLFREQGIYRVEASGSAGTVDLGTCVPMDIGFGIMTRIPIKILGAQIHGFQIIIPKEIPPGKMVKISQTEPISCIAELRNACLVREDGSISLCIIKHPD